MTEAAERDEGLSAAFEAGAIWRGKQESFPWRKAQEAAQSYAKKANAARPSEHHEPEGGQTYRELWEQMQEVAQANGFDGCTDAIVRAQKAEAKLAEHREPGAGELREALEWYGEQARLCRLIHSEGDAGRHALSEDGGKRAKAALTAAPAPQAETPSAGMPQPLPMPTFRFQGMRTTTDSALHPPASPAEGDAT